MKKRILAVLLVVAVSALSIAFVVGLFYLESIPEPQVPVMEAVQDSNKVGVIIFEYRHDGVIERSYVQDDKFFGEGGWQWVESSIQEIDADNWTFRFTYQFRCDQENAVVLITDRGIQANGVVYRLDTPGANTIWFTGLHSYLLDMVEDYFPGILVDNG